MTSRFGPLRARDGVSLRVEAGSFIALLGENGAGKSTLVKCLVGYHQPDAGEITAAGRERDIRSPHDAHALGIGMVYQHFTLVPSMTVAENLVMARDEVPAVVDWQAEWRSLTAFMATVPFRLDLDRPVARLAAGEKQKVEIMKQLYRRRRFMILDEPTSMLTPAEADVGRVAGDGVSLVFRGGEIVGIAGVSGNGQRELVEALIGQRTPAGGELLVGCEPFHATRAEIRRLRVFSLPEEPLRDAC